MAGHVILTGDRGPLYSQSDFTLSALRQFSDGRVPRRATHALWTLGSAASPLLKMLEGTHHGVQATERERTMVRLWIEQARRIQAPMRALARVWWADTRRTSSIGATCRGPGWRQPGVYLAVVAPSATAVRWPYPNSLGEHRGCRPGISSTATRAFGFPGTFSTI